MNMGHISSLTLIAVYNTDKISIMENFFKLSKKNYKRMIFSK